MMATLDRDQELTLILGLDEADDDATLRRRVAARLQMPEDALPPVGIRKRSIDARRGSVRFHVTVGFAPETPAVLGAPDPREVQGEPRAVIVGDGPAGLFCAYELARAGVSCVVVDRGKPVQPRRRDLQGLHQRGEVDPDSNYCFGEGGAGTFSDGKLYTRSHKRGDVRDVLELLVLHGAPAAILTEARPHIGSNKLPRVVSALRARLEGLGVRFEFGARVVDLVTAPRDRGRAVQGVRLADGRALGADAVVLATGHSARDVLDLLARHGVAFESKPFALGVRIEHPQRLINEIQYGRAAGHPKLPAASYRVAQAVDGRGVFSFCMCPGGWIIPAVTAPGELVLNGMSLAKRDSPFANSGLVVAVEPGDVEAAGHRGPLGGVAFQRAIEAAAFTAGGGALRAPATRATDFVAGRASCTLPESSYIPGLTAGNVANALDCAGVRLAERLRAALRVFDRRLRGYITEEAVLVGVESRTSSPVRVPRDPETLMNPALEGLYPAGEGAGYAGGIMSSAVDGVRIARAIVGTLRA